MYNWNAHMRGAGFPVQPQQMMPFNGPHMAQMSFQHPQHQWVQHQQQNMGMMMTQGWPPTGQQAMYPPHGLMPGMMTLPVSSVMGGSGPAPPSQPPPPLPAEPPPSSPNAAKVQALPPPPPPTNKDVQPPQQSEQKVSKWDQKSKQQSSSTESTALPGQIKPKPPQSPAPVQPKPPESPAPVQPKPPQSPASVQPKPQQSIVTGQTNSVQASTTSQVTSVQGTAPGQIDAQITTGQVNGSSIDQANPAIGTGQVNSAQGPTLGQVTPGQPAGQINTGQVTPAYGSLTDQVNLTRSQGQVNPSHGRPTVQVNSFQSPPPGQVNFFQGPPHGQINSFQGSTTSQINSFQNPPPGQFNSSQTPTTSQINSFQNPPPGQFNSSQTPTTRQINPAAGQSLLAHGQTASQMPATHGITAGQGHTPSVAVVTDQSVHLGSIAPDPMLMAELEKVKAEEVLFLEQYKQWKKQYDDWREQNQNHPNKEQFQQYLEQWKTYEQQMEIRRQGIQTQKQMIEERLLQMSATSSSSQFGAHGQMGDMTSQSGWDNDTNRADVTEHMIVHSQMQTSGESAAEFSYGYPNSGGMESGMVNQFSEQAGQGQRTTNVLPEQTAQGQRTTNVLPEQTGIGQRTTNVLPEQPVQGKRTTNVLPEQAWIEQRTSNVVPEQTGKGQRTSNFLPEHAGQGKRFANFPHNQIEEDKGEEDMNLDDDEESGAGGIIESGQHVGGNAWQKTMTGSYKQDTGDDWHSSKQGHDNQSRDQWAVHGESVAGGASRSGRDLGWTSQRGGSYREHSQPANSRGRGSSVTSSVRSNYNSGDADVDTDFRFSRDAGHGGFRQKDGGCDDDNYREFDDSASGADTFQNDGLQESFTAGRGQWYAGSENELHRGREFLRGRGGEFLRGRGGDFLRGTGGEFQMDRGDFQRGRGFDFQRGRGGEFQRGRSDFQIGRGGNFLRGRAGSYQSSSSDFQREDTEGPFNDSSVPEDCEDIGGPLRGRRPLPSLMSFEFDGRRMNRFSDFEPERAEQDSEFVHGDLRHGAVRDTPEYFSGGDDNGQDNEVAFSQRGRGISHRGRAVEHGRGSVGLRNIAGFNNDYLEGDRLRLMGSAQRGQRGMRGDAEGQRFPQSGRGAGRGEYLMDRVGQELKTSGQPFSLKDNIGGGLGQQKVGPDAPLRDNTWDNEPDDSLTELYDRPPRDHLSSGAAPGNGQIAERGRGQRIPDENEPGVKKSRLLLETDKTSHEALQTGDLTTGPIERKPYRDYRDPYVRDPYLDPYARWPPYSLDRPVFDRFGPKPSVYEIPRERKLLPESIDYCHGGINRERIVQPATVIDYGHGQANERQAAEKTDIVKGGAEMRSAREGQDLSRMSELKDRDSSYRRSDMSSRTSDLDVIPRYGPRGDAFSDRDHKVYEEAGGETGSKSLRDWSLDDSVADFDGDHRSRIQDRFSQEDGQHKYDRTSRLISRDDDWKSIGRGAEQTNLFSGRGDDRLTFRETGSGRSNLDYSEKDDYFSRRDAQFSSRLNPAYLDRDIEFTLDRDDRTARGQAAVKDSRYGSIASDVYSRDDRVGEHGLDRDGERYSRALSPSDNITPARATSPVQSKAEIVKVEDLLCSPNRDSRPTQIVVIIRGLPGSGKTYVSKLLREKEISCGGAAPRMLCLDDYFMVEAEKEVADQDTGKKVKKRILEYEYEQAVEETYRQSLLKSFKKTVDDGFFPFIIVDATNDRVAHFSEFWSYAKSKGFQVYVGELNADVSTCIQRNIHHWTEWDIEKVKNNWEPLPSHYIRMDLRWLLQEDSIPEVVMEDTTTEGGKVDKDDEDEEEESEFSEVNTKSRWELDTSEETLDKLDGIRVSKKHIAEHQSLNDYLQLDQMDDDYFSRESLPGKKRVRWADLEEEKTQNRRRNLGFIVGQTQQDWQRITDNDFASKALNQTKYFYKNN